MKEKPDEIDHELLCPLSNSLALNLVLCEDGFVYES
jgi:hypothetical protein